MKVAHQRKERTKRSPGRVTVREVCRLANVSIATVSRVMNNKPGAGEDVRRKVLDAMKELNYFPRAAARHLSSQKNDTIGVVFQDLSSSWFVTIFKGIVNRMSGKYHLLTTLSTREGDESELPRRMLAEGRVDGLIWLDTRAKPATVRRVGEQLLPLVVIQQHFEDAAVNSVSIEGKSGAYQAMSHLLGLGHRKILVVTGRKDDADSMLKLEGVRLALAEKGAKLPPSAFVEGHHVGALAIDAVARHLDAHPRPQAIFAFSDDMAIALTLWLRERGIRVPQDVAIVGYDGIPESRLLGLTTVETPMYDMGVLAAQMLIERIEAGTAAREARHVVLRGSLRVRETCGASLKSV